MVDGRYRILEALGQGGMGAVYRVEDQRSGDELALKRLLVRGAGRRRHELGFRREFHTLSGLDHPGIVDVRDYGVDDQGPYYTMELLQGGDLQERGVCELEETGAALHDVAAALAFLHARRMVHRDLSMRNVRFDDAGRAKLIDFGIMSTVGVSGELVGTPPYVPPETMLGLPIDHRADLYSLGALAYRALVGRHAYPARTFEELPAMWREPPPPPSTHRPQVPAGLDELVMSLLSPDALGRPASAAEVIDRLEGVVGLPPAPHDDQRRGWLQSTALVGREVEIDRMKRWLGRAFAERDPAGVAIVVEGPSGMGKSRLLQEMGLEAQLEGATVLRLQAGARHGPLALMQEVAEQLVNRHPEETRRAARPFVSLLGGVLPQLREDGGAPLASSLGDPAEDRLRFQRAVVDWLRALAAERRLCVVVDDVQRADEASAAVLASVATVVGALPLALVLGLRTDESARAGAAIATLRDQGQTLRVRGLGVAQVRQLVETTFGDVTDGDRIARWMHDVASGSPLHCVELCRRLVDDDVLRYAGGMWTLAGDLEATEAPRELAEVMRARVVGLDPSARDLAEVLSVQGGLLPLELCAELGRPRDDDRLLDDLFLLIGEEVLVSAGQGYRFRHDGLREALLRGLDDERRRALHQRAADALERHHLGRPDLEEEVEIGWHHHRGHRPERAAEILERAGRRLYDNHSFSDAIPPLEAALAHLEASGASRRGTLELRQMLMRAGVMCDRDVLLRYADDTIEAIRHDAGLVTAARLQPRLGNLLAVGLGVVAAGARWLLRGARGPSPVAALTAFIALVSYTASARSLSFDYERLESLIALLRPLKALRGRMPAAAYLLTENFLLIALGHFEPVRRNCEACLHAVEHDGLTPLPDIDRRIAEGAARYMIASTYALDQERRYETHLDALEGLDLRFFDTGVLVDRLYFHRLRGEEERALELQAETEALHVQLGNAWVFESQLAYISGIAYGLTRDVLGLKRTLASLERLLEAGYRFEGYCELTRGEYLRERGDADRARVHLDRALASSREDEVLLRQIIFAALAETELARDRPEAARAEAERALSIGEDPDARLETGQLRAGRALALAEAALGDDEGAARRLDALLARAEPLASPSICGGLHEARARVALAAEDRASYLHHLNRCARWFRDTRNPALVARVERLEQAGTTSRDERHGVATSEAVTVVANSDARSLVSKALGGGRGRRERLERALALLVEACHGDRGYLFVLREDGPAVVAPGVGAEPSSQLLRAVEHRFRDGPSETAAELVTMDERDPDRHRLVDLTLEGPRLVAVAAVIMGGMPSQVPDPSLVAELATTLYEAGDVASRTERRD